MSWYAIGTVSVTNNNVAITGAGGTAWAANIQAGDAFKGPDEKLYEVQSVNSDTAITLAKVYAGTTAAGAAYAIIPTQGRVRDLAAAVLQLITDVGDVDAALTVVSGRVGLGKSPNASAKLDVNGQVWVDAPTGDATLRMLASGVEKGKLGVTSAGRVYIESNSAEVMTWLNGNVGIGTASPTSKLHVNGAILASGGLTVAALNQAITATAFNASGIQYGLISNTSAAVNSNAALILGVAPAGNSDPYVRFDDATGGFWSLGSDGSAASAFKLSRSPNLGTGDVLTASAAGNVTVNAPSSGAALTVLGALRVDAAVTTAAPTGGAAGSPPALPVGYVTINIGGTDRKIAFYA